MKEAKVFEKQTIRIEADLNKDQLSNLLRKIYGSETVVLATNVQTSHTEVSLWAYVASHVIE